MTVDKVSWGHRRNINIADIYSMEELVGEIAKTVSCGGNILVNVGPSKEGTIIPVFEERLRQMGSWLTVNGEAIYETTPWTTQNDTIDGNVWYTMKGDIVYGILLGWPEDDKVELGAPKLKEGVSQVGMIGHDGELQFTAEKDRVRIQLPSLGRLINRCGKGCQWGYVLKFQGLLEEIHRAGEEETDSALQEPEIEIANK